MRLAIDVEQLRRVDVRVALCGRELHVAEQFLNRTKIGAALKQVRRERVAQRVRADTEPCAAGRHVTRHETLHASPRQAGATEVEEQRVPGLRSSVPGCS